MSDKIYVVEDKMSDTYVKDAKAMSLWLLNKEFRGIGDTQEAAAGRVQRKWRAPAVALLRLKHREITDMKISTWASIFDAFRRAGGTIDALYEKEKGRHQGNSALVRFARFLAGDGSGEDGEKDQAG